MVVVVGTGRARGGRDDNTAPAKTIVYSHRVERPLMTG